ncbi:hypothetical protein J4233_02760 [Candidatus Pacearchaeota archaeon]|nr:hypothetical protein [Candidatus Pacearchaeota archaeon]
MIVEIIILALAVPAGFLLAYWANDELVSGRGWFRLIMGLCLILGEVFTFLENWTIVLTLGFILIATLISYWRSFDKNWIRRRI